MVCSLGVLQMKSDAVFCFKYISLQLLAEECRTDLTLVIWRSLASFLF